jgi:hypothetical protein
MVAERIDRRSRGELVRLESRVRRDETVRTLTHIRTHARHIHLAVVADRPDLALHSAGAIVSMADRRLRQLGGSDDAA